MLDGERATGLVELQTCAGHGVAGGLGMLDPLGHLCDHANPVRPLPEDSGRPTGWSAATGGGVEGIDGEPSMASDTPYSDTGYLTPVEGVTVGLHWVQVTVWATLGDVQALLENGWLDTWAAGQFFGWEPNDPERPKFYTAAHCVQVVTFGSADFVQVRLRGEHIDVLGQEAAFDLLNRLLRGVHRARCSRLDVAFDGVPFSPRDVRAAVHAGNFNSRTVKPGRDGCWFIEGEGDTAYVPPRRSVPLLFRCYDRRGPVRFEIEAKDRMAERLSLQLVECGGDLAAFVPHVLGAARSFCDFVDCTSAPRIDRCTALAWWAEFIRGAPKGRRIAQAARSERHPAGTMMFHVDRFWRTFIAYKRAGLLGWFDGQCEARAVKGWGPADDERVAEMLTARASGYNGLPPVEEEDGAPF